MGEARAGGSRGRRALLLALAGLTGLAGCAGQQRAAETSMPIASEPYSEERVLAEAQDFFGRGAQGLADVLNRVFRDKGPPTGYIKGNEGGGAFGLGFRYGRGTLYMQDGTATDVYWRGPSIGFDYGGNASKTFILVYDLPNLEALYSRFGGVEGSVYFVGGVGVTYNRSDDTVLAPVRFGVGWRQGVNVGYLHLSSERAWNPF